MTKSEIYKFFTDKGASPYFEIVDSPQFEISGITKCIGTSSMNLDDFIRRHMNNLDKTTFIYSKQDFCDNMKYLRYIIFDIPQKVIKYRRERILKIKKIINKI